MEAFNNNDITVVIPAHNCESFLVETIASLEQQTMRPGRVIIVENASSDHTGPRLAELAAASPLTIDCVRTDCPGVSNARNLGFSLATTSLIAMLDADDVYTHGFLEQALVAFNAIPELSVFFGNRTTLRDGEIGAMPFLEGTRVVELPFTEPRPGIRQVEDGLFQQMVHASFISCSGAVVRRDHAYQSGLFPLHLKSSEDRHFFCRLVLNRKAAYTLDITHYYRIHDCSRTGASSWVSICQNSVLCVHMLAMEMAGQELSSVQRGALANARKAALLRLFYAAAEQGPACYREVREWAKNHCFRNPRPVFYLLKAARNGFS